MHDAKADPTWTGGRLVRIGRDRTTSPARFAGVVGDGMSTRNDGQHGKPVVGGRVGSATGREGVRPQAGGGGARSTDEAG